MGKRGKHRRKWQQTVVRGELRRGPLARWWFALAGLFVCGLAFTVWAVGRDKPTPYGYQVVAAYPHDSRAYCQGLVFDQGVLYEGTGKYGASSLRKVDLKSGRSLKQVPLDAHLFGEGITIWEDKIIQLTWQEQVGIVYNREDLSESARFKYAGEGWGLTHDGKHLIISDGSSTLRFLDPRDFHEVKRLTVRNGQQRMRRLNELEYVNGEIFANVWYEDYILRISPHSGKVTGWIELRDLWPQSQRPDRDSVLNGIAYDPANDRLFVTGKNWPNLFEIRLTERNASPR